MKRHSVMEEITTRDERNSIRSAGYPKIFMNSMSLYVTCMSISLVECQISRPHS